MPALNHPHAQRLTLSNGLTLSVRHAPRLKRCAAFLRVAAGSHDVPTAWPGLAHFLEHLLFLGTERFPATDNLMAYVQRHGGQVNAQTRERHTDFFFELPPEAFEGGLERLCDMLAHPRMNLDEQLREREVLHAEFIAWAREPSAQREMNLFQPLNPAHPLRAFHAGNRYSLPVPRASFQQALKDFYQQFYQTGQISLSLAGPHSVDELQALAEQHFAQLQPGQNVMQATPTRLLTSAEHGYQHIDGQRLNLLFACEQLPPAATQTLEFLCHWINADKPGGLVAQLRQQQLIDSLKATPLYQFNGQALLQIEFSAPTDIDQSATQISDMFYDWLAFFSAQDWSELREEYRLLQQRQQDVCSALDLARSECEQRVPALSEQAVAALQAVLEQLQPTPITAYQHAWQLPAPNPYLKAPEEPVSAGLIRGQTSAHRGLRTFAQDRLRSRRDVSAMRFSTAMPSLNGEAAIYLRWRLAVMPAANLLPGLEHSLRSLQQDARQAGVELSLSTQGNDWLLKMNGLHSPMPAILEHALHSLSTQSADSFVNPRPATPLMPIRQLLKRLPEIGQPYTEPAISDLQQCWATAQWDGLAVGLPAATQALITALLGKVPGTPDTHLTALERQGEHRWHTEPCDSSEQALLLFCPVPGADMADEAAWRLLAHVAQTPFYQRLRVELQLGYAVFSGLRQINGRTGLLFGVQSPHASTSEIFEHIKMFLADLPSLVSSLDETSFIQAQKTLAQQFSPESLGVSQASELLWQAKLAGHPSDYLRALYAALIALSPGTTLRAAQLINQSDCDWLCLATESFYQWRSGSLPTM
ncbi:MAG: pyrroloquinoline quinone biosynthesis protein PqqF [Pseudomonadota bacterium]